MENIVPATIDILIPTYRRPAALAITLASLCSQTYRDFKVIISDQTEDSDPLEAEEVQAIIRILEAHGHCVDLYKHLPRRGMAEHRQFLLDQVQARYALFIDDDLFLEPFVIENLLAALQEEGCGFAGSAVMGLSYSDDYRPHQQHIEFWKGPVEPETIRVDSPEWERYVLHNANNLNHVQQQLGLTPDTQRKYKVAWVGACVLYDVAKLRECGGFNFWHELPVEHCGEDVLAQHRVMARYGGFGIIPSGVYHLELPTTLENREINAPRLLSFN